MRPPGPTTCVCVSSSRSTVPVSRVIARSASWNPGSGSNSPTLFVIVGSVITMATSRGSRALRRASASLNCTIFVLEVTSRGSPPSSGTSFPSWRSTSASSKWPWYFPSKNRTLSRPVNVREMRIASVFACVALSVNCHFGSPYRRPSSSATHGASSFGSMNWAPRRHAS